MWMVTSQNITWTWLWNRIKPLVFAPMKQTITVVRVSRSKTQILDAIRWNASIMALTEFALERMTRILMATSRPMRDVKKRVIAAVGYHAKMYGPRRSARNLQKKANVIRWNLLKFAVPLAKTIKVYAFTVIHSLKSHSENSFSI